MTKEEKSAAECAHDVKGPRAIVSSGILAIQSIYWIYGEKARGSERQISPFRPPLSKAPHRVMEKPRVHRSRADAEDISLFV